MKTSERLTINALLLIIVLVLPSVPYSQAYLLEYDDDVYNPLYQYRAAYKRTTPKYDRGRLGGIVRKMSGRRFVDDSYYKNSYKRGFVQPGLVTYEALRKQQSLLSQNRHRNNVIENARIFNQNGRR